MGGLLLILVVGFLVKLTLKSKFEERARKIANQAEKNDNSSGDDEKDWKQKMQSRTGWEEVAQRYVMEWKMVWKDVTVGFTVAGIIAVFVPVEFFQSLFIGAGQESNSFLEILAQSVVGPVAAFFTFIGSMGNIPLAAVLFGQGVSFAGVMAFIFSDLVVFPVLRIQAKYYGWKMAFYLLLILFCALVGVSIVMHYGFDLLGILPENSGSQSMSDRTFFKMDYSLFLNIYFILISLVCIYVWYGKKASSASSKRSIGDWVLLILSLVSYAWLAIGIAVVPLM